MVCIDKPWRRGSWVACWHCSNYLATSKTWLAHRLAPRPGAMCGRRLHSPQPSGLELLQHHHQHQQSLYTTLSDLISCFCSFVFIGWTNFQIIVALSVWWFFGLCLWFSYCTTITNTCTVCVIFLTLCVENVQNWDDHIDENASAY